MRKIDDERVRFYLKHQALIEEWASVRSDLMVVAQRFYLSIGDDLEEVAPDLGDDVAVWVTDGTWSKVGFYRDSWLSEAGTPLAMATVEWVRGKTDFREGWRASGIRCDSDLEEGRNLREGITDLIRDHRESLGYPRSSKWWPAWRPVPGVADTEYWNDLDPYRQVLVDEVLAAWNNFASPVDEAISALHP